MILFIHHFILETLELQHTTQVTCLVLNYNMMLFVVLFIFWCDECWYYVLHV